ncbi:helix-turn-helix domain-containing protein [Actinokineospora sp. UTMC 2448]|uniref:helix-turn-helix domain-containing protein n=1 Tax=Actinokineospora sp. UTMC 2448 TaxID=2268449 RepID=UPI0021641FEB|nr:helix-turn-helix transcriptional regulator [Actinokineospora sp. UTMC 2448]UVS81860.1 Helix-turn-helix domain protein [Actinokineospora sp. UTMC 2448]
MNLDAVTQAVGREVRDARQRRGMTLAQLAANLPSGIRVPTLSGYETGTKTITVSRLVEICDVIGVSAPAVLDAALHRVGLGIAAVGATIDLRSVIDTTTEHLVPLRQWARTQLANGADAVVTVDPKMIRDMAAFCGLTTPSMAAELDKHRPLQQDITERA